jgi:hypothetical protein
MFDDQQDVCYHSPVDIAFLSRQWEGRGPGCLVLSGVHTEHHQCQKRLVSERADGRELRGGKA